VSAAGGLISLLVGTVLLRLVVTGTYGRYVRVGMGPWLAVAGVAVIALGLVTLLRSGEPRGGAPVDPEGSGEPRGGAPVDPEGSGVLEGGAPAGAPVDGAGGDGHRGDSRMGWLLLAPIAALLLVAPPTLGSFGVDRGTQVNIRAGGAVLLPLRPGPRPIAMTLLEYGQRAFDHDGASFNGAAVQLTGFVAGTEPGGFRLARYQIACCAADAAPVVLRVVGARSVPARDQWVRITGNFQPGGGEIPLLAASNVVEIRAPEDPYE
jgi:uncharacterized repeat protein (TIGR03943 family)